MQSLTLAKGYLQRVVVIGEAPTDGVGCKLVCVEHRVMNGECEWR